MSRIQWRGAKRILGEVTIIVVGVLIALGADELRETRAEQELVESYVVDLASDLRGDSVLFDHLLAPGYLPAQRVATDSLIALLSEPGARVPAATVLSYLRAQVLIPFAEKRRSTYEDLVGSGRLGLIEDSRLRGDLAAYYSKGIVTHQPGYEAYLQTSFFPFTHRLTQVLGTARYFAMAQCEVRVGSDAAANACYEEASEGDELDLIRADAELAALVTDQYMQQFFALIGVGEAQNQVLTLLAQLDSMAGAS